jgi:chemotaxis protein CheZ
MGFYWFRGECHVANKVFRIERAMPAGYDSNGQDIEEIRHRQVMDAIANLQVAGAAKETVQEQNDTPNEVLESIRKELAQSNKLKAELDEIRTSIVNTKREITSLHHSGFVGEDQATASDELDAVVKGTEDATEKILTAAEIIESNAANLANALKSGADHDVALDIQEQAIAVFEACNFQDLTGQRITKVVNTLKFIEERVDYMMTIWGGEESFAGIKPEKQTGKTSDDHLLNGPAMEDAIDVASQDDIDALFD